MVKTMKIDENMKFSGLPHFLFYFVIYHRNEISSPMSLNQEFGQLPAGSCPLKKLRGGP